MQAATDGTRGRFQIFEAKLPGKAPPRSGRSSDVELTSHTHFLFGPSKSLPVLTDALFPTPNDLCNGFELIAGLLFPVHPRSPSIRRFLVEQGSQYPLCSLFGHRSVPSLSHVIHRAGSSINAYSITFLEHLLFSAAPVAVPRSAPHILPRATLVTIHC